MSQKMIRARSQGQGCCYLVNPAAGRGRAGRSWQPPPGAVTFDSRAVAEAYAAGYREFIGVGGDGTHHAILNQCVDLVILDEITYRPLSFGSGNDWVRTLRRLPGDGPWSLATGRIEYGGRVRHFLNVAGCCYDAVVVRRTEAARFKHRWLYPLYTLWFLRDFRPPRCRVTYDGTTVEGRFHTINVGLGRYSGGGMRLVPHADPLGDRFAVTLAPALSPLKILLHSWRFYTGTIGNMPEITTAYAREVTVTPLEEEVEFEADGEWLGIGTVNFSLAEVRLQCSG